MNRQAKLSLAVLALAALVAFAMIALRPEPEEQERVEAVPLVETLAFAAENAPLDVLGAGTVQAREEVSVGAEVPGRLVYVAPGFQEGGLVSRGAPLFRIDASDYQNQVRGAQADVAAQDVAVLQAREEVRIARAELDRYADRQGADPVAATIDDNDYASRILPPRELQRARAPANGRPAPTALATRQPQLRSAQAARQRAGAQLEDARLALSRTVVRAPFTGLVRSEEAAVGRLVQPGQELGSIVATDAYEVRVSLSEGDAALVPGLLANGGSRIPAQVYLDYGGLRWRWSAYVDRADAILNEQTRTIDVFLRVPNPLGAGTRVSEESEATRAPPLLLGSFVDVEIRGASPEPFARIPVSALRPGNRVWLVRQNRLEIVPVRVIQRTDRWAYVTTPQLGRGARLVTSNLRTPVEGMRVRVQAERGSTVRSPPRKAAGDE